jgi:hypothetical protein
MRSLEREKRGFWVAKFLGKQQIEDEQGRLTGEYALTYTNPELVIGTVSPRSGNTWGDGFGIGVDCDRTVIFDKIGMNLDESCIIWVDAKPQLDDTGALVLDELGLPVTPNDYTVSMVAESYNVTMLAIKKAE